MPGTSTGDNEAFRRFVRGVWEHDVTPLLRGQRADQRARTARATGKAAAATGLFVDSLLGLKGRPFARFMTVMGASLGAILPDVWDWNWLRERANERQREVVAEQMRRRAAELTEADALALFGLSTTATRAELREVWHEFSRRWHPDKAPDDQTRPEYHVRFVTYSAAYQRLRQGLRRRPPARAVGVALKKRPQVWRAPAVAIV